MSETYVQASDVLIRDLDRAILIRARGADGVLSLTGAGTEIWRALAAPVTMEELLASLAQRFDVAPGSISADVHHIVDTLIRARLVERPTA